MSSVGGEDDDSVDRRATAANHVLIPKSGTTHPEVGDNVEGPKVCRSPAAEIVIRVHVLPGEELQLDDLIVVLEAMKMETKISSPVLGKIKSIKVTAGDAGKLNQV